MIVSAQDVCRTRNCAAAECTHDAENYSRLCWRCAKKDNVKLHVTPPPSQPTLPCNNCKLEKPDTEFCHQQRAHARRGRHPECRACGALRRKAHRLKPGVVERETRVAREYRQHQRAQRRAQLGWPPT